MKKKERVYLSLGTNLGNRLENLRAAVSLIDQRLGRPVAVSSVYESEAWGYRSPHPFYNICIGLEVSLDPQELLDQLQMIESDLGREKQEGPMEQEGPTEQEARIEQEGGKEQQGGNKHNSLGWHEKSNAYSDRLIDIDLIFMGSRVLRLPQLQVPHPAMEERRFVLKPMAEIAPAWIHPVSGYTVSELLAKCSDQGTVRVAGTLNHL